MAVSNSTDFSMTALEIIKAARMKIGIHASEEPLADHEAVEGRRTLNMMLKAWQADGVTATFETEGQFNTVHGQSAYSFASGGDFTTVPINITDVRIARGGADLSMAELSREEYLAIPLKTTQGYPIQWFYDRQRENGSLYVWPAPDSTAGTLKFTYIRRIMDMDSNTNNIDLPQEWYEAVIYNLADRFAEDYGLVNTETAIKVSAKAQIAYETVKGFNTGQYRGSIRIVPATSSRTRRAG